MQSFMYTINIYLYNNYKFLITELCVHVHVYTGTYICVIIIIITLLTIKN